MANLNSENPHVGRKFQEFVQTILKEGGLTTSQSLLPKTRFFLNAVVLTTTRDHLVF